MITAGSDKQVADQIAAIDAELGGRASAPVNTIGADQLGASKGVYSTYFPKPSAYIGLGSTAVATKDAYVANLATETDALKTEQDAGKGGIQELFSKLGLQGRKKTDAFEKGGIYADKRAIDEITNDIESTERAYTKRIESLRKNNPDAMLKSGLDTAILDLDREKASVLADKAIVLSAKTRSYETARNIISEKVDAETEDLKTTLEGMKFFYAENADRLSKNETTLLNEQIRTAEREYDTARDLRSKIGQMQLQAASNGAGASVVSAIGKAATLEAAIAAGGAFLLDASLRNGDGDGITAPAAPKKTLEQFIKEKEAAAFMNVVPGSTLYKQWEAEYQQSYGGGSSDVSTGKLTAEDKQRLTQAGLAGLTADVQNYFLNTEPAFQMYVARQTSGGSGAKTYSALDKMYQDWLAANGSDVGGFSAEDF